MRRTTPPRFASPASSRHACVATGPPISRPVPWTSIGAGRIQRPGQGDGRARRGRSPGPHRGQAGMGLGQLPSRPFELAEGAQGDALTARELVEHFDIDQVNWHHILWKTEQMIRATSPTPAATRLRGPHLPSGTLGAVPPSWPRSRRSPLARAPMERPHGRVLTAEDQDAVIA